MRETVASNLEGLRMAATSMEKDHFVAAIMEQFDLLYTERLRAEAAEKRIAELEAASRWIPVSEKLPEKNKKVLLYDSWSGQIDSGTLRRIDGHDEAIQEGIYEWDTDGCYYHGDNFERITHWRELPQPPQEEK